VELYRLQDLTDDIGHLSETFITKFASLEKKEFTKLSEDVLQLFTHNAWPGNVSQLKNIIQRLSTERMIRGSHQPPAPYIPGLKLINPS
jgi:transcriptional regulator with PAS, ATPase and Fis domain